MQYGIVIQPVATIYEIPAETMVKDGMTLSAIADEAMYGTGLAITGEEVTGAEVTGAEVTGAEVTGAEITGREAAGARISAGAHVLRLYGLCAERSSAACLFRGNDGVGGRRSYGDHSFLRRCGFRAKSTGSKACQPVPGRSGECDTV